MKKTIYNVYVPMESQEQCDRMKQLCIDYGLKYWRDEIAFQFDGLEHNPFFKWNDDFSNWDGYGNSNYIQVTEQEFIELLKNMKDE